MSHLRPHLGLSVDSTDQRLIYKTKQQMDIHAGSFPPKLWIRGPAGSGKAYLILKKASRLAIDIVKKAKGHVNEKILIVCPNSLWCKDLQKKLHALIAKETKENVTGVLEIITFAELVSQLNEGNRPNFEHDKEYAVNQALECLPKNGYWGYYDHIFVYDGEDLFGKNWPLLLEKMHKGSVQSEPAGLQQTGFFWVMYDTNQFLYSAEDRHFSCLRNSALLDKVFRTKNILTQLKKYFKPMMPHDSITLGHQEAGPPIEWDDSLVRGIKEIDAAPLVVEWLTKLHSDGCQARATCILVETKVKQIYLRYALDALETESQSGKSLVETSTNAVVVESVRQFKGMRSKVVILYNPPFEDDPYSDTKGFLYTAISSCTCRLIVISTKEGVAALKSTVGVQENSCGLGNKVMESPGHQLSLDGDVGYDYAKE